MLLPNIDQAIIERSKVVDYLLNPAHPDNGGKAPFFLGYGFARANPEVLEKAIHDMIRQIHAGQEIASRWGTKYIVDGRISAPKGITPSVRTVWIINAGQSAPRLVTAYPLARR